jgi:hypothetical protein
VIVQVGGDGFLERLAQWRPVPKGELQVSNAPLGLEPPVVDQAASSAGWAPMIGGARFVPVIKRGAEIVE